MHRRGLLAAGLALLALPACARGGTQPLPLPALPAGGPLRLLGMLQLDASDPDLSGISGAHLAPDGTLTLVTDMARHAALRLELAPDGRLLGVVKRRGGRLRDGAGAPLPRGHVGDAESLARTPDGLWLVGFERWHRIRAYRDLDGPGAYVEAPPGLDRAPINGGLEALAVLPDGRWVALSEELAAGPGLLRGWIGGPGSWQDLAWQPEPDFAPTDAAALPDGGLLVLERAFSIFSGFTGRLVRIPAPALVPGAVLRGEEVLRLDAPLPAENWEALGVARIGGRVLVAILSDDNESRLQRSLLLLAELVD